MLKTQRTAQGAAHREIRYHLKILYCLKHGTEVENTAIEILFFSSITSQHVRCF